jgi:hypothetical protein
MSGNKEAAIMRHHSFTRRSFTLLASAMAAAATGQALAETAGKVSFVTGNVTATTPDGQSRALRRGDAINGGDRIETRGGRLQIRFTDGGFVALQPNTVFGVDQYLYANKAPEETSLFFSLLRGGMRTITGAIGKVNKQSYKVRTPVATIGIRGTGYRATTTDNRTLVSVGHGFVNVANGFGNLTGGAGQNILVTNDVPPGLSREAANLSATGPEGDNEQEQEQEGRSDTTQRFGEQVTGAGDSLLGDRDGSGNYLYIEQGILADTDTVTNTPLYSFAFPITGITDSPYAATFDATRNGGLKTLGDPVLDAGTLQYNGVKTVGNISWGEFTNGTAGYNNNGLLANTTLSASQFEAYVVGVTPSPDILPPNARASYNLIGGTTPRLNLSTAGTLDIFKIDVDFVQQRFDVRLDLTLFGGTPSAETFTAQQVDIPAQYGLNPFLLDNLPTTSTGSSCSSSACATDIIGFFAGNPPPPNIGGTQIVGTDGTIQAYNQIGAGYTMTTGQGTITGTAGLGLTGLPAFYQYSAMAAPIYNGQGMATFLQLNQQILRNGSELLAMADGGNYPMFDSGTLQFANVGQNSHLAWGEFTNGAAALDNLGSGLVLASGSYEPYIFGTPSTTLLGLGSATYSKQDYTPARVNQTSTAALNQLDITINFDLALLDVALMLTTSGGDIAQVSGSGINVPDIFLDGAFALSSSTSGELSVSGSACPSFSCSADISGFFAGVGGTHIGAAYAVKGTTAGDIKGVASLAMGAPQPSASVLPDAQLYTMASTGSASPLSGGYPDGTPKSMALEADFAGNGELISAQSLYPLTQTVLGNQSATATDVGTSKTLSWGRFTNGNVTADGNAIALTPLRQRALHHRAGNSGRHDACHQSWQQCSHLYQHRPYHPHRSRRSRRWRRPGRHLGGKLFDRSDDG